MRTYLVLILFVLFLMVGCRKAPSSNCTPLPQTSPSFGWNYTTTQSYNYAPCYNPKNSNQFVFLQHVPSGIALYEYDMSSNLLTELYNGNIYYTASWGSNNWILFDVSNDIYKIKANGDSLTRLTTGGISCYPKWSPNSTEYIYSLYAGYGTSGMIANSSGQIIDSFSLSFDSRCAWIDTTIADLYGNKGFVVFNTVTRSQVLVYYSTDVTSYSGACFINTTTFTWSDYTGIYLTNIQNGQTTRVESMCDSKTYVSPSYSNLSNKVIWNKRVQIPVNSNTMNIISTIVMMNPDGSNEQEINIP